MFNKTCLGSYNPFHDRTMRILSVQLTPFPLPPTDKCNCILFTVIPLNFYSNFQDLYLREVAYCFLSGPSCSKVGWRSAMDKSLSSGWCNQFPKYLSAGWWFIQWIAPSNVWTSGAGTLCKLPRIFLEQILYSCVCLKPVIRGMPTFLKPRCFTKECSLLKGDRIFCLPLGLCNFQS